MKKQIALSLVASVALVACGGDGSASLPFERVTQARWNIVEIRSNTRAVQESEGKGTNALAGSAVGAGAAALMGKSPMGMVAGAAAGAGAAALLPTKTLTNEKANCMIMADSPSGVTFSQLYASDSDESEDKRNVTKCLLAKPGDVLVITKTEHRYCNGWNNDRNCQYGNPTYAMEIELRRKGE